MGKEGYEFIGSFQITCGDKLVKELDGVTDKEQRKAILDAFIGNNRNAFFYHSELQAIANAQDEWLEV